VETITSIALGIGFGIMFVLAMMLIAFILAFIDYLIHKNKPESVIEHPEYINFDTYDKNGRKVLRRELYERMKGGR
jgi:archaellum biogenesis protein FlaJ (TadC family)